jgi:integrase
MAQTFLTSSRHGTVFYFRRRVPDDLQKIIGKPYLVKSLATAHRGAAIVLARAYAARTDAIYRNLRAMKKKESEGFQVDYSFELDFGDDGTIRKIRVNAEPHESEAVNSALKAALQNSPQQLGVKQVSPLTKPLITALALLEDYFREGIGLKSWKDHDTTRRRDYGPIWVKFSAHADRHGLTLAAAKQYRAEVLASDVSQETKNRNFYRVCTIVNFGVDHHELDARMLPALKMPKSNGRGRNSRAKSYLPFNQDDLALLFHSTAYKTNSFKKPSHYWLPLLGLYTGARLEELAELNLSAFKTMEEIPALILSDVETTPGGKNKYAPRQVPIHKELIKAGLLRYAETLRAAGHDRLFPDIEASARDGYGKRATVDFTAYRRSVDVGQGEGHRSRKVFHSFRATLAGKFYHHGIDGDLSRRLTGHAAIDVHQGTYLGAASIPIKRAAAALDQISFGLEHPPFVDTVAYQKSRNKKRYGS